MSGKIWILVKILVSHIVLIKKWKKKKRLIEFNLSKSKDDEDDARTFFAEDHNNESNKAHVTNIKSERHSF